MTSIPHMIGRYEVVSQIGRGDMVALYRAWDPQLARPIAIKILIAENDALREQFKRDASSVAHLRHPHIVTILDVGDDNGRPFIAMEYIEGRTLADVIGSHEPISTLRKLQLMQELCDALEFAHNSGIIHRDITSTSILVDANGILKILHFGIATFASSTTTTRGAALMGGLNYMAPEQITEESIDDRSVIFAVGAVFYELLSGRSGFLPGVESLDPLMDDQAEPLKTVSRIDPETVAIVRRCLEKDPSRRYPSLDALRTDLRRALVHLQGDAPTRRALDREELARRRSKQIQLHLDRAEQALNGGDYDAGIDACEEVLLLDSENAQALDLMDRARTALDQRQAEDWLDEAENEVQRGALSTAIALVDSAATLAPSLPRVVRVRRNVEEAIRQRERALQRAEHDQRARDIVEQAKQTFGVGAHEEALQMLTRFEPGHDLVTQAVEELRAEADRIAEQKRLEAEHHARQQRITAELATAREEIAQEQFADAVDRLRTLQEVDGQSSEITEAIAAAEAGQAEADRKAARQQELSEHVARAAGLLARNNAAAAMSRVEAALAIDPQYTPAVTLKAKVHDALQRIAQRREIEERLARERAQAFASTTDTAQRSTSHEEAIATVAGTLELHPDPVVDLDPIVDPDPSVDPDHLGAPQVFQHQRAAQADLDTAGTLTTVALHPASESGEVRLPREDIGSLEEFNEEHPTPAPTERLTLRRDDLRALDHVSEEFVQERPAAATEPQTLRRDDARALTLVMSQRSANAPVTPQPSVSNAVRPGAGVSRPTAATVVTNTARARSLRRWLRATALGAIAVAGSAYYATSGQSSLPGEGTVTLAATPEPLKSNVPSPPPPAVAETPAVSADREAELDRQVGELHTRARQAFGRGDWREGFTAVTEATRLRPGDAASKVILADALQEARTRATEARNAARAAGVPIRSATFRAADQKQREGDELARGGKTNEGIRALWETVGLFQIARADGDKSREKPAVDVAGRRDAPAARTESLPGPVPPAPEPNISATPGTPLAAEATPNHPAAPSPPPAVATPPPAAPAPPTATEDASRSTTAARSNASGSTPPADDRPAATPTANAPFSAAAAAAQERPAIQTTLEAYATGYSSLDAAAIKRIYPGIDENGLKRRFGAYRSQHVQVQIEQIQMIGPTSANVSTLQTTAASMQVGGPQRDSRRIVFRLEKRNGSWIILEHR